MRASLRLSPLPLLLLSLLALTACPHRTVVVDGVEMDYDAAADEQFRLAEQAWRAGDWSAAADGFRDFLASFEESDRADDALWYLGDALDRLGREDEATDAYVTLVHEHPLSSRVPEARLRIARGLLEGEGAAKADPERILELLAPAFDDLPDDQRLEAAQILAEAAADTEDWTEAVRWIAEVYDLAPRGRARQDAEAALVRLIDEEVPPEGLAALSEDLRPESPAYPLVVMKLAKLHYHLGDYREALSSLDRYLRRWPDGRFADDARDLRARLERLAEVRPTVVGLILPLSGRYQVFGEAVLRGVGLALDLQDARGRRSPVTVVVRDSEGDPDKAMAALENLVLDEQVVAVIGPLLSSTATAAAAQAEELGVPMLTLSRADGLPDLGPWVFRNALTGEAQARALVQFAIEELGAERFATLYPNVSYGESMADHYWDEVASRRKEMRAAERYEHDQTTFSEPVKKMVGRYYLEYRESYQEALRRIRAEVSDPYRRRKAVERAREQLQPVTDFDVLFVPDSYKTVSLIAPALAVEDVITNVCDEAALRRIRRTTGNEDLHTVRLLGSNLWHNDELVRRGGKYVDCAIFVDGFFAESERPATRDFVERYRAAQGPESKPSYLEAIGYDSARLLSEVIERSRPDRRADLRDRLLEVQGFPGATGTTSFAPNGEAVKSLFFLTVQEDRIVEWPPPPRDAEDGEAAGAD